MSSGRRKEVWVAAATCGVATAVYASLLFTPGVSESLGLLSSALTCLFLSWLISAVMKSKNERKCAEQSPAVKAVVVFPLRSALPASIRNPAATITNAFSVDLEDYFHTEVASQVVSLQSWDSITIPTRDTKGRLRSALRRCCR